MDFFEIEPAAKAAFSEQYSDAYLRHLDATKHKRDMAELLWAAFANGYAEATNKAANVCDQIADSKVKTGALKLTAQQCAAAIRKT